MRTLLATVVTVVLGACGPSSGGGGGGGGDEGGGGGGGDASGPTSCTNASQCGGSEVCNPDGNVCADDVPCSTADQCGNGGVCNGTTCEPNTTGGECVGDENCLSGETCNQGHCGCLGVAFQAEPVVPNVLIVLDRSGSMRTEEGGGGQSKWTIAKSALNQILDDHGNQVRFGLDMFASNDWCAAGQVNVGIGDGTAADISDTIADTTADSGTPIAATMNALKNYSGLKDPNHPNYVLLLTDGKEECGGGNPATPVAALRNQTPSVSTFVVGFGTGVNGTQLNDMATKGGTALPGPTKYYQANDAAQLSDALDAILGTVLSCSYTLDQVPEDLGELYVYQDDAPISQDTTHTDGWDYDPANGTLTFYGAACDALESGGVTDLSIVYGCPGVEVE